MKTVRPVYLLHDHYSRQFVKRLWIGLRAERHEYIKGGEPFLTFMVEEISETAQFGTYVTSSGNSFHVEEFEVDRKTISNFIARCHSIFSHDKEYTVTVLHTANKTLQFIHAFLWARRPEDVSKWKLTKAKTLPHLPVMNLTEEFDIYIPANAIPNLTLLFETSSYPPTGSQELFEKYHNGEFSLYELVNEINAPRILGGIIAERDYNDVIGRVIWVDGELCKRLINNPREFHLEKHDREDQKFQIFGLERGFGTCFRARELSLWPIPAIKPFEIALTAKTRSKFDKTYIIWGAWINATGIEKDKDVTFTEDSFPLGISNKLERFADPYFHLKSKEEYVSNVYPEGLQHKRDYGAEELQHVVAGRMSFFPIAVETEIDELIRNVCKILV